MLYNEALESVNEFMEKSGIRTLCKEVCKGQCCCDIASSLRKKRCNSNILCHEKLPCVCFVCSTMQAFIKRTIPVAEYNLSKQQYQVSKIIGQRIKEDDIYLSHYYLENIKRLHFPEIFYFTSQTTKKTKEAINKLHTEILSLKGNHTNGRSRIIQAVYNLGIKLV